MVFLTEGPIIFFYILFIDGYIRIGRTIENVIIFNFKMQKANFQIHFLKKNSTYA